jgi:hypothetical protein
MPPPAFVRRRSCPPLLSVLTRYVCLSRVQPRLGCFALACDQRHTVVGLNQKGGCYPHRAVPRSFLNHVFTILAIWSSTRLRRRSTSSQWGSVLPREGCLGHRAANVMPASLPQSPRSREFSRHGFALLAALLCRPLSTTRVAVFPCFRRGIVDYPPAPGAMASAYGVKHAHGVPPQNLREVRQSKCVARAKFFWSRLWHWI